ncbi:thioredoxin family protein [Candidatus Bathyarchaeota archaeon]|nr:thioredoxin family protein [Candidatus Bathyarchaeota archaeon]
MGSAKLVELSMENISEFIESNRVAILDFWGSDCGVCVAMLPVLEGFASEWEGVAALGKFCVDDVWERVSERFGILGTPSFIVYRDGMEVDRTIGFHGNKTLSWMRELIEKG